ncbi:hypothetical protein SGPA1_22009 [Streptomyces misionensis JCM 4497]
MTAADTRRHRLRCHPFVVRMTIVPAVLALLGDGLMAAAPARPSRPRCRRRGRETGRRRAAAVGPDVDSHPSFRDRTALMSRAGHGPRAVVAGPRAGGPAGGGGGRSGGRPVPQRHVGHMPQVVRVAPLAAWTAMPFAMVMRWRASCPGSCTEERGRPEREAEAAHRCGRTPDTGRLDVAPAYGTQLRWKAPKLIAAADEKVYGANVRTVHVLAPAPVKTGPATVPKSVGPAVPVERRTPPDGYRRAIEAHRQAVRPSRADPAIAEAVERQTAATRELRPQRLPRAGGRAGSARERPCRASPAGRHRPCRCVAPGAGRAGRGSFRRDGIPPGRELGVRASESVGCWPR